MEWITVSLEVLMFDKQFYFLIAPRAPHHYKESVFFFFFFFPATNRINLLSCSLWFGKDYFLKKALNLFLEINSNYATPC